MLNCDEKGLLSIMLNLPEADYCSVENLTKFCSNSKDDVNKILNNLIRKNFVVNLSGKYIVNKEMIPAMLIIENDKGGN